MNAANILLSNFFDLSDQSGSNSQIIGRLLVRKRKWLALLLEEERISRKVTTKRKHFLDTISEMPNDVFYSHFKMQISTFEKLHSLLSLFWTQHPTGRPGISLKLSLYITLWKLGNQKSFREVSERFNVGMGSCYKAFFRCVRLITQQQQLIQFPQTESSQRKVTEGFMSLCSHPFPSVLGCIDATHFRMLQPSKQSKINYNRNGTHSIIAQAVADSEMRFLNIFVSYPGRHNDAAVWSVSPLRRAITNGIIRFPAECHLLGDEAYPLETFLMVPYHDDGFLSAEKTTFNSVLSSTRVCVDQAFTILRKKYKILNLIEVRDVKLAKEIIISCAVLHNFIINEEGPPDPAVNNAESEEPNPTNILPSYQNECEEARLKRERLTTLLST